MDTTFSPNINSNNSLSSSQSKLISELNQQISHQQQPPFLNELRDVSTSISSFLRDVDDLRNHITSITSAIDAQLPRHLLLLLNDPVTADVIEVIFAEWNPNGTENGEVEVRHENNDDLRKVLEESSDKLEGIDVLKNKESDSFVSEEDVDVWKMIEAIDCDDDNDDDDDDDNDNDDNNDDVSKKKPKEADIIDEINVLSKKKAEEIDKSKEDDRGIEESKAEKKKNEENDVLKEDGEIEILEDGEIDTLEDGEIDVSKEEDREIEVSKKKPKEIIVSKKNNPKEIDISEKKKHKEIDIYGEVDEICTSKKKHEEIRIAKRKHEEIFKAKNKKHEEIDISKKKKHGEIDNSRKKKYEEIDNSKKKKHEEIDNLRKKKDEEIYITKKKHDENDALKRPAEIDVSKKPEISNTLWTSEAVTLTTSKERETSKEDGEDNTFTENDAPKKPQEETDASKKLVEIDVLNKPKEIDVLNKPDEIDEPNKPEENVVSEKASSKKPVIVRRLEYLCKEMLAKKMKKHVMEHISEMNSLHQQIAKALMLAKSPAKLVLNSVGRYFLQTSKVYHSGESRHQQIAARQASVLILECFVMISDDGIEITKEDKERAENAAIGWRKRMMREGGLIKMEAVDAMGLLLFISGFGIPDGVFSNEDFRDLIKASNVKETYSALRHSTILIQKLPEVIDWMVKNNLEIEAADIAYAFGLEDKCHPETILMTFLHNIIKDTQNGSSLQVNAAKMQQLSDVKSLRICLETHKISEKIEQLQKVIKELDLKSTEEKSTLKRKEKETGFSKDLNHQQAKRICISHENLPHGQNPHANYGIRPYNQNLPSNYVTAYSASPVFSAPLLPPNTLSSVPSGLAGSYAPSVCGGPFADPMAYTNNLWLYGLHGGQLYPGQTQPCLPFPSPWRSPAESYRGSRGPGSSTRHPSHLH